MTAGLLVIFAGYAIGSYGIVLLKGWNIPWSQWINPLNPWTWPKDMSGHMIPPGRVFPGGTSAAPSGSAPPYVPPVNTLPSPKGGKCPPGYLLRDGVCWPPIASGPPASM